MTTSIKSATTQECKNRINDLFGDISKDDIVVMPLASLHDAEEKHSSIRVGSIFDLQKIVKAKFENPIQLEDVVLVSQQPEFEIKSTNTSDLNDKLKELGFDNLNMSDIAIVNAEDLDKASENTNSVRKTNRFKK